MARYARNIAINRLKEASMQQNKSNNASSLFDELVEVMRKLRDPATGCVWDKEQNFTTIAPYTIEEAYEVADAIARNDMGDLREELGDLLFQVVFHAQMAHEDNLFSIEDVIAAIIQKMVARHPHVFGQADFRSAEEQTLAWEEQKAAERAAKAQAHNALSALDGVALALPALKRAQKIQARAARVGFDWPNHNGAFDKITEEAAEIKTALTENADIEKITDEIGDLLFSVVNAARHLGVDSETALRAASAKFERRFRHVEEIATKANQKMSDMSLDQLEALWQRAKTIPAPTSSHSHI
jgi:nucleoside triphosphate diphosphatase